MAAAAAKFGQAGVTYLRSEPRRLAWASLGTLGRACYGVMDDTASWKNRLAQVTRATVAFPGDTDLAFAQYTNPLTSTWSELAVVRPPLPYVNEYQIRYNRHLDAQYIADAHGLQLLTDAHLAQANDLSDWIIEPLGGGKHSCWPKTWSPATPTSTPTRQHSRRRAPTSEACSSPRRSSRTTRHPGADQTMACGRDDRGEK